MAYKRLERILIQLDSVDSTNQYAADLVRSTSVTNGTLVWALHQLDGKGQRSSSWTSEPNKNLTFSVIVRPKLKAKHSFYLNIIASLSVRKALEDLGLEAKIKWPNDLLIGQKKICGILVQNQISSEIIQHSIMGIGVNVNQDSFKDLPLATSISLEKKQDLELTELLDQIYGYLDFYLDHLMHSNFELLKKLYYQHLYLNGVEAKFRDSEGEFEGKILGIDENGMLNIERDGSKKSYDIKELTYC